MSDIPTLKPCPFCGGAVQIERCTDTFERLHGRRQWWGIVCRNTRNWGGSCALETTPQASIEAVVERWNKRVPEDALRAALEDARGFLSRHTRADFEPAQRLRETINKALK
jgi:hypothetical protein